MNLEKQQVVVKGDVAYETVLDKIKKTGKEVGGVVDGVLLLFLLILLRRCCLAKSRWRRVVLNKYTVGFGHVRGYHQSHCWVLQFHPFSQMSH